MMTTTTIIFRVIIIIVITKILILFVLKYFLRLYLRKPFDSILDAVLTVSPNKQYLGIFNPTTPAHTEPLSRRIIFH